MFYYLNILLLIIKECKVISGSFSGATGGNTTKAFSAVPGCLRQAKAFAATHLFVWSVKRHIKMLAGDFSLCAAIMHTTGSGAPLMFLKLPLRYHQIFRASCCMTIIYNYLVITVIVIHLKCSLWFGSCWQLLLIEPFYSCEPSTFLHGVPSTPYMLHVLHKARA